ncbi:MAG: hypothetical protein RR740_00565 [Pseudomonas sp.]
MIPGPKVRQAITAWFHKESDLDDNDVGLYPEHWEMIGKEVTHNGAALTRYWSRIHDLELRMEGLNSDSFPGIVRTVEQDDQMVTIVWDQEPTGVYKCASIRYRELEIKNKAAGVAGYGEWA